VGKLIVKKIQTISQSIYDFIVEYIANHVCAPSIRDIAQGCFVSTTTVLDHLSKLEAQGKIRREYGKARGIAVVDLLDKRQP
jgi:SOS-response transcriptional repressor LexA